MKDDDSVPITFWASFWLWARPVPLPWVVLGPLLLLSWGILINQMLLSLGKTSLCPSSIHYRNIMFSRSCKHLPKTSMVTSAGATEPAMSQKVTQWIQQVLWRAMSTIPPSTLRWLIQSWLYISFWSSSCIGVFSGFHWQRSSLVKGLVLSQEPAGGVG